MTNRVITRERGVIPGCRAPGPDSHMAVDGLGAALAGSGEATVYHRHLARSASRRDQAIADQTGT
jgi:hypothetical protein